MSSRGRGKRARILELRDVRAGYAGVDVVRDRAAIRARVGYMPQRFSLYQDLSVAQNLRFFAVEKVFIIL